MGILALLGLIGPLLLAAPEPPAADAAYRYRFVYRMESKTPRGPAAREIRGQVVVDRRRFRVDFDRDLGLMQDGCWLVSTDGGATLAFVRPPNDKQPKGGVARVDVNEVSQAASEAIQGMASVIAFKVREPKVTVHESSKPETVLGLSARKTTIEIGYALEASLQGVSWSTTTTSKTEWWTAAELGEVKIPIVDGRTAFATGMPEVDKLLKEATGRLRGLPLKMIGESEVRDAKGESTSSRTTLLVQDLERTKADEELFVVPTEGYAELDPLSVLALNP